MNDLSDEDLHYYADGYGESVRLQSMAREVLRRREMEARLTEWAEQLDRDGVRAGLGSVAPFIATELRNRMKGKS